MAAFNLPGLPELPGIPGLPGTVSMGADAYGKLMKKYGNFELAQAEVLINGQTVSKGKSNAFVGELSVELTSGFEASVVNLRIYGTYVQNEAKFMIDGIEKQIVLGALIQVKLGYLAGMEPVFTGFVSSVSYVYDGIGQPYIGVTGMDAKGVMMSSCYVSTLTARSYGEAVTEIFKRTAYENMKTARIITGISVADTSDRNPGGSNQERQAEETVVMSSESDYDFVVKAAKKFNCDFFVDRGTVIFRKAKSNTNSLMSLAPAKGILKFNLEYSLTGMVQNIEVRSMNAGKGEVIVSKSKYSKDMSSSSKAKALIKDSKKVYIDPSVYTQEQANARAQSLLEKISHRLGHIECECIGIPEIFPGYFIDIKVGSPADNKFYITRVTHTLRDSGEFITKIYGTADSVAVPGLPF
ncbi:MAG: hypothetical protein LBR54_02950 [Oscillospiraceae bacterium]|jgi:phage protein D|nr:hypothetical protein [Oscillospiraceae bacterium]